MKALALAAILAASQAHAATVLSGPGALIYGSDGALDVGGRAHYGYRVGGGHPAGVFSYVDDSRVITRDGQYAMAVQRIDRKPFDLLSVTLEVFDNYSGDTPDPQLVLWDELGRYMSFSKGFGYGTIDTSDVFKGTRGVFVAVVSPLRLYVISPVDPTRYVTPQDLCNADYCTALRVDSMTVDGPAIVPLPASGLFLLAGIGALLRLRYRARRLSP